MSIIIFALICLFTVHFHKQLYLLCNNNTYTFEFSLFGLHFHCLLHFLPVALLFPHRVSQHSSLLQLPLVLFLLLQLNLPIAFQLFLVLILLSLRECTPFIHDALVVNRVMHFTFLVVVFFVAISFSA